MNTPTPTARARQALADEPRRIMQTEFGPDGNCQSACLAMLLGLNIEDVPNFTRLGKGISFMCAKLQQEWLLERGLYIWTIVPHQGLPWPLPYGFYIAGGMSPRGIHHAVIYRDGKLWHDPHPDGDGIAEVTDLDIILPIGFKPALLAPPVGTGELPPKVDAAVAKLHEVSKWDEAQSDALADIMAHVHDQATAIVEAERERDEARADREREAAARIVAEQIGMRMQRALEKIESDPAIHTLPRAEAVAREALFPTHPLDNNAALSGEKK